MSILKKNPKALVVIGLVALVIANVSNFYFRHLDMKLHEDLFDGIYGMLMGVFFGASILYIYAVRKLRQR